MAIDKIESKVGSKFEYVVTADDEGLKIKDLLRRRLNFSSRLMRRLKGNESVFLNGEEIRMYHRPVPGDRVAVVFPEEKSEFVPEGIPIAVIYEDEDLLLINKQPGHVVHPTKGHPGGTIANGIMNYMLHQEKQYKIRFVNRLDMDTSGLLIIAKNSHCQDDLANQMAADEVIKKYVAVVKGLLKEDEGTIDLPIGKVHDEDVQRAVVPDGYPSVTHYRVLARYSGSNELKSESSACTAGPDSFAYTGTGIQEGELTGAEGFSLVELHLETGRTHQIRVHMKYIGHPVVGDVLYDVREPGLISRQALHAQYLSFRHPVTGEHLEAVAPLPADMEALLEKLQQK